MVSNPNNKNKGNLPFMFLEQLRGRTLMIELNTIVSDLLALAAKTEERGLP